MRFYFDTETSGLPQWRLPPEHPSQPFLVEFAGILLDDDGTEKAQFRMIIAPPPGRSIPDEVARIHGITTEEASRVGVPLHFATGVLREMMRISDGHLVAHNIKFDLFIMQIAAAQTGMTPQKMRDTFGTVRPTCTMTLATPIVNLPPTAKMLAAGFNKPKSPTLSECFKHFFDHDFEGAHSALVDVRGCIDIHRAMGWRQS